jgi:hypothetical protein
MRAARAAPELLGRDERRLVGLHVRPEGESVLLRVIGGALEVALHAAEVHHGGWRLQHVEGHGAHAAGRERCAGDNLAVMAASYFTHRPTPTR